LDILSLLPSLLPTPFAFSVLHLFRKR
jgi:hypothetical protein